MVGVEEIVGDNLVIVVRSMSKGAAAVAVTQRPDARHIRLQLIVNNDVAAVIGRNAGLVETQVARVGDTPYRQKNVSTQYFRRTFVTLHVDGDTAIALCQRDTFRIQPDLYPLSLQNFAHGLGNIFVFTSNQARSHLYNRDFAAEAAIHLPKFQTNITSADDDKMLRQKIDVHHRRVREKWDIMDPRHLGNRGAPANVDENLVGLQELHR